MEIKKEYDAKLDSKGRFTVRKARFKDYHVTENADGSLILEPQVRVHPDTLKQIEQSMKNREAGKQGTPINFDELPEA